MSDELYIWVTLLGRPASKIHDTLVRIYGSLENAWNSNKKEDMTKEINDISLLKSRIFDQSIKDKTKIYYEKTIKANAKITHLYKEDYPYMLKQTYEPPFVLYYYGQLPSNDMPLVSVVGSRKCTAYGRKVTYDLSKNIASMGIGIVSGLAKGIDARSHAGALDANGYTIGVLGGGPDNIYPSENEVLYYRIKEKGLILSEYAPSTMPLKHHFPARNRIIAGLGKGTLVCEAGIKSGAMITVNFAINEGRDIYSVPGNIDSLYSEGCNKLIKAGAIIVSDYTDVLEALGMLEPKKKAGTLGWLSGLDKEEALVCDSIYCGDKNINEICDKTGIECSKVIALITMLEVKGIVGRDKFGEYVVII